MYVIRLFPNCFIIGYPVLEFDFWKAHYSTKFTLTIGFPVTSIVCVGSSCTIFICNTFELATRKRRRCNPIYSEMDSWFNSWIISVGPRNETCRDITNGLRHDDDSFLCQLPRNFDQWKRKISNDFNRTSKTGQTF